MNPKYLLAKKKKKNLSPFNSTKFVCNLDAAAKGKVCLSKLKSGI